jgi:hypothetical protein
VSAICALPYFRWITSAIESHRAASDEVDESLRRQRPGIPVAVVARLPFLGSVDAEQADALTAKLHGIAIRDREAVRSSCATYV